MSQEEGQILIVDDNPSNISVLMDYLGSLNFKTRVATSGERALQLAERAKPDLILLDIMMPKVDGYETCRKFKEQPSLAEIPIIFMSALDDVSDKVKGFDCGAVDYITKPIQQEEVLARIRLHLTLKRQRKELQELNQLKDTFFSILAHDLRGPLGAVNNLAENFVSSLDIFSKEDLNEMATHLYEATNNSYKLLENLLSWARFQRGVMEYKPEQISLQDCVHEAVVLVQNKAREKEDTIHDNVDDSFFVYADRDMLSAVLRNILSNSIKFTSRGEIIIDAQSHDNHVILSISDTGIGMNDKILEGLFRVDRKVKRRGTRDELGTGLGLILCRDFIKKMSGSISVSSDEGKGSIFSIRLPSSKPEV